MGAIAGIYHLNKEPVPGNDGYEMMKLLQRFPCDEAMLWQQESVFLGCSMQFITSESEEAFLPYYDSERKLAITADALIENRTELLDKLGIACTKRKGLPDSQLILLAYEKWGEKLPEYVEGDFSFMIWDQKHQKFFGARDYVGSKTFYYFYNQNHFAFCTLIQPLLLLPYVENRLNELWIIGLLAVPDMFDRMDSTSTVYKYIHQLPPSHSISVHHGAVKIKKYCRLPEGRI